MARSSAVAVKRVAPRQRRVQLTVGELLAAACDAAGGDPVQVALLLERGPLAELISKRIKFE